MNKKMKAVIVLSFLLVTSFSMLIPTSDAASPTSYVTITLTNSQTTATSVNFQQLLKIDWSTYATELNANVSNVRFYNSTLFSSSTELSGWIEDNNTTTATSSNVWVNLSGTIVPASGSATIYMTFLPTTASWSSHWGLAPQLSTKYGQFDNGAKVFEFYDNFSGTTLASDWTVSTVDSAPAPTVDNGISFGAGTGGTGLPGQVMYNNAHTFSLPGNFIFDASITQVTTATSNQAGIAIWGQTPVASSGEIDNTVASTIEPALNYRLFNVNSAGTLNSVNVATTADSGIMSVLFPSTSVTDMQINYGSLIANTVDVPSASTSYYFGFTIQSSVTMSVQWIDVRLYPPNGVMPVASFGSLTTVSTVGYQISFQQTSLPSGTIWGIRLNDTSKVYWLNSTTQYDNITGLPNGTYDFQVINATGYASNPSTGLLTISGANLTQSIIFTGYTTTFTESGLPSGDTWYVNLTDQSGLSQSSTGQKLSGNTTSLSTHEPNGTYTFTYQTSDRSKYKGGTGSFTVNGASITEDVTFSAVLYYLNFTQLSKPKSVEWGVNVSGTIKTGYGNLSFQLTNGTYYWNASAINGSFNDPIGWWRLTNGSGEVLLHPVTLSLAQTSISLIKTDATTPPTQTSFPGVKIIINGKNYNNNITFTRAYNITFEEVGIANAFQWDVNLSNGFGTTLVDKHIFISNDVTQVYFNSTEGNYTNATYTGSIQILVYGSTGVRYKNFTSVSISEIVNGKNLVLVYNFVMQYFLTTSSNPIGGGYHSPYSGWFNASSTVQLTATSNSSFEFTGFQGTGTSSYTGMGYYSSGQYITTITMTNPITEIMDFNNYIVLTFYMENLTSGTVWGVKLTDSSGTLVQWNNGTGYYIVFDIAQGTYSYQVTGVKSTPQSNQISVTSSTEILLQYDITTYDVNFKEEGLQPGANWNVEIFSNAFSYTSSGTSILNFEVPNGSYSYTAGSVYGYISNNSSGSFTVSGKSLLVYVNWTQGNPLILEGIRHFVAIYLNTSDFIISAGTQIPINVDWNKYSAFENQNLSNVLFMNSTFYPLYAWIENNASSSFHNSTVWVKITSQISYNSSMVIYLVWQSKDHNNFNKFGYLGEASQLSPMYGEWNNIRFVMNPGLVYQVYYPSINYQINLSDLAKLQNTSMVKGSSVYSVFNATVNYGFTQISGTTGSVYYTYGGGTSLLSDASVMENNVLFTYGLWSALDTFPNPPVGFNTNTAFMIKMFGFAVINTATTYFYTVPDNVMQIWEQGNNTAPWISMSGMKEILNADQGGSATDTILSAPAMVQGIERISLIYAQGSPGISSPNPGSQGPANMNLWTSSSVSYYSPTPVNALPTFTFGSPASSYNSFYEYGLPANTNWSIAISGSGFSKLYTTDSNLIYTYLPNGTYIYTVGSIVNGSYHSGLVDVGSTHYVPNPSNGHVIVTGAFTVQYIIFAKNDLLEYDLIPGQAQYNNGSIILPIFVLNQNNQPANASVITNIWKNMSLTYIARLQNQTETIPFTFSNSGLGMFAIFFSLDVVEVKSIKTSNATLSMVSDFQRTAYYTGIATGIAGSASFLNVVVKGQNITNQPPPGVSPTNNNTSVPWYVGLIANYYPPYSSNPLTETGNILIWILDNSGGRALTLMVGLATLGYFAWMINKSRKDKGDKKWKYRVEKKLDALYRKITGGS